VADIGSLDLSVFHWRHFLSFNSFNAHDGACLLAAVYYYTVKHHVCNSKNTIVRGNRGFAALSSKLFEILKFVNDD